MLIINYKLIYYGAISFNKIVEFSLSANVVKIIKVEY